MEFGELKSKIDKTKEWLKKELSGLRTGRASPALVEGIKVDYFGTPTPLSHLASVRIEDAKTLIVEPWDKNSLESVSKAIGNSSLGIQPIASKESIRIVLPPLTQERRVLLVKILNEKMEEAKIQLRRIRDESWSETQRREKEKEISEDEKFRLKDKLEEEIKGGAEELGKIAEGKKREINN